MSYGWHQMTKTYIVGVLDGDSGGGAGNVFEEIVDEYFSNLMKAINPQIQEANKT